MLPELQAAAMALGVDPYDVAAAPVRRGTVRGQARLMIQARWIAAMLLKERGWSYPMIGKALRRHHSTFVRALWIMSEQQATFAPMIVRAAAIARELRSQKASTGDVKVGTAADDGETGQRHRNALHRSSHAFYGENRGVASETEVQGVSRDV